MINLDLYRTAAEPNQFTPGRFRARIEHLDGRLSFLSSIDFATEAEAIDYADEVFRGVRAGFRY